MQEAEGLNILNSLTNGEVVTMDRAAAIDKFREYEAAVRRSHAKADEVMTETFRALKDGHGVIHLASALKKGGVHNKTGLPKLAITRADEKIVYFRRNGSGGLYGATRRQAERVHQGSVNVYRQYVAPVGTFPSYQQMAQAAGQSMGSFYLPGFNDTHSAPVPVIPPHLRPTDARSKYQILFEINEWKMVAPVDPMLLRPLTHGLAVVVAHWDLSPVERLVMGALLGN
jgi:hypothetical protein